MTTIKYIICINLTKLKQIDKCAFRAPQTATAEAYQYIDNHVSEFTSPMQRSSYAYNTQTWLLREMYILYDITSYTTLELYCSCNMNCILSWTLVFYLAGLSIALISCMFKAFSLLLAVKPILYCVNCILFYASFLSLSSHTNGSPGCMIIKGWIRSMFIMYSNSRYSCKDQTLIRSVIYSKRWYNMENRKNTIPTTQISFTAFMIMIKW